MKHLCLVSQRGTDTGMTAKNLAIVWAPNLLRSSQDKLSMSGSATSIVSTGENLRDIAVQAVCTESLIKYCDILFAENLPSVSSELGTFELGITVGFQEKEIDIDSAIAARSKDAPEGTPRQRTKSIAIADTPSSSKFTVFQQRRPSQQPCSFANRFGAGVKCHRSDASKAFSKSSFALVLEQEESGHFDYEDEEEESQGPQSLQPIVVNKKFSRLMKLERLGKIFHLRIYHWNIFIVKYVFSGPNRV